MIITQKVDLNPRRSSFLNNCGGLSKVEESCSSVSDSSSINDIIVNKNQSLNMPVMRKPEDSFDASVHDSVDLDTPLVACKFMK